MKQKQLFSPYYEEPEFNFSTAQTNIPLSALGTTFLSKFGPGAAGTPSAPNADRWPTRIVIRTNQTISVSLTPAKQTASPGTPVNDNITVASTDSPFTIDGIQFGDVLITNNSGGTAAIKLFISDSQY